MAEPVFVGADIGWQIDPTPESTGVCTIEGSKVVDCSLVTSDEEIINYSIKRDADFIGVDIPLVVSNVESNRPVESELLSRGYSVYPANRNRFNQVYGGIRGEELVEKLTEYGYELSQDTTTPKSVIEVYPNPTIQATIGSFPKYKGVNKHEMFTALTETWRRTTESVEDVEFGEFKDIVPDSEGKVTKQDLKTVGDLIDAFYSAYVLKLDHNYSNRTEVFGDLQSGSILTAKL